MPDYRRAYVAGGTYFFAVTTYLRRPILTDPRCMAALRTAIRTVRKSHPFEILAWVVLPDHLHCVWTDYVHYNPVKHGYVSRTALWPHSTFHWYVREGIYPADWAGGAVAGESGEFGE